MTLVATLKAISEDFTKAQQAAREAAKQALTPGLKEFLKQNPEIKAIGWSQYTPYFNDGEECVFGVGELNYALAEGFDEENINGEGWDYSFYKQPPSISESSWKALKDLNQVLQGCEDQLQDAFGDHVQIIVTTKGVEVTEYEHD